MSDKVVDMAPARKRRASSTTAPRQQAAACDPGVEGAAATPDAVVEGAPSIVPDARAIWLRERKKGIGASDGAAILGFDPFRDELDVYCEKAGLTEPSQDTWLTRWGRRVQGVIGEAYTEETGRPVHDLGEHVIQRHPVLPWLGATLDFTTAGSMQAPDPFGRPAQQLADLAAAHGIGGAPLEVKAVNLFKADEWREDPPLHYQIQLQLQLACTGAEWGSLCALLAGLRIAWVDLKRNEKFLAAALPKLEEFWMRVQRKDPPQPGPRSHDAIRALYPKDNGLLITLPEDTGALVEKWQAAKAASDQANEDAELLENVLRARMGEATNGMLPDGRSLTLKTTERKGYTQVVAPTTYRTLRIYTPKHLKTREKR